RRGVYLLNGAHGVEDARQLPGEARDLVLGEADPRQGGDMLDGRPINGCHQSSLVRTNVDHGLLPRDSVARRIDRESFVLLGGTAALLMQVAHPLVAAGVAAHSDFQRDPLGRLMRTLDITLASVFGDTPTDYAA